MAQLTRSAKARAARAIEDVHLAYYAKGGIRDLEDKLGEQRGAAARHIFALAIYASENAETLEEAIAQFQALCAYAEARYKQEHDVVNLKEVLPTWAVFKSNILRGMREYGLDPIEYRSEGAFRVAMQRQQEQLALPSPPKLTQRAIDKALSTTVTYDPVRTLLSQILFECQSLKRSKQKDAEAVLRETMDRLSQFVDQRKAG
ncbi:MAG TPA: hypothetical protein VF161_02080 [Steroidobacteraceae bacterium]